MPQLTILYGVFSAVAVLFYWLIPPRLRGVFLAAASSLLLLYLDVFSFALLCILTAAVYFSSERAGFKRYYIFVLFGLLILFGGVRLVQAVRRMNETDYVFVLLGFGFYVLKLIHYRVERNANTFRTHGFLDFYNYMMFFPTILIGPIHRFEDFLRSDRRLRWDTSMFADGLRRLLYGYFKVIVIANWFIVFQLLPVLAVLEPGPSAWSTMLDSIVYGFHLYFAFAGYSDIAIGMGALFGYRICENFRNPFWKKNIGEFWQSWHMSLSFWCRQYIFLPWYAKSRNLISAMLATMIAIGLWHEFSVRFLLWGLYHGIGILIWRLYQRVVKPRMPVIENRLWTGMTAVLSVALTFTFVMIGFTIPRSHTVGQIIDHFRLLLGAGL